MNKATNILIFFCLGASVVLFIISIPITINSINHQKAINDYLENALVREVNIIDCEKQNEYIVFGNNYEIKVSYFTKPIFEGGEFKLHPILKFVNNKSYNDISALKKTNILYFKDKPEQSAILEASTKINNFSIYERQDIGFICLISSIVLFSVFRIFVLSNRKSS